MLIGLTGTCCSGKNAVAEILAADGWRCIDVDQLGHQALQLVSDKLAAAFGKEAIKSDGSPNRAWLGQVVFNDAQKLAELEKLVHPKMFELTDQAIAAAQSTGQAVCLNAAIMYKMPQAKQCSHIIEVQACFVLRLLRAYRRDRLPLPFILARMNSQAELFTRRSQYNDRLLRIPNNLSRKELHNRVRVLAARLRLEYQDSLSTDSP